MKKVRIIGTGGYLPGNPISNAEMEALVGPLTEELLEGISIQRRFWMIDPATGEHYDSNSGMAYKAAVQALEAADVAPGEVELMLLATGTPDYPLPPVVNLVMDKLGIQQCATLEIRSGGAGGIQALDIARFYLEQGTYKTALVIGSEVISPVLAPLFLGKSPDDIRMRDRLPLYMFGDGAGAMVLQATEELDGGLIGGAMNCIGGGRKPGIQSIGGGTHAPIHRQLQAPRLVDLRVDVVEAGKVTPLMITDALTKILAQTGVKATEIDHCLIPEGNVGWMLEELHEAGLLTPEWKALDGRIYDNLAMTGAVGCAAVPLFLDEGWRTGKILPGERVLMLGIEATKWIYAGMIVDWTAPTPRK